jgi:hypothetical protein
MIETISKCSRLIREKNKMSFYLRKDAQRWFSKIDSDLELKYDLFHYCFMAGLVSGKKTKAEPADITEIIQSFPRKYKPHAQLLVAAFISEEIRQSGVSSSNRKELHRVISSLIDLQSPVHLSETGLALFNRYSYGGFDIVYEWFDGKKPINLESFLPKYYRHISEVT